MSDEIRVGDRFEITVEVVEGPSKKDVSIRIPISHSASWVVPAPSGVLLSGRRLPGPIKVGDRVERMGTKASVVAIDGPVAWVKFDGNPANTTVFLSSLTPIPGDRP